MSFLQTLASAFKGGASPRVPLARTFTSPWLYAEGSAKAPFDYARAVKRGYLDNPVAQRAVRLVAEGIGGAPLVPVDPKLAALVSATSAGQSLLETLASQLLLHGNAYVQVIKDGTGAPVELFALRPERVSVIAGVDGWPSGYPLALGRDAMVVPEFSTSVAVTASGFERRNSLWSDARLRFDVGPGVRSEAELGVLLAFFRARRGAARGFRLRDPSDFSSNAMTGGPTAADQLLGTGNGLTASFPLLKRYGETGAEQLRRITRPRADSVLVSVDGIATTAFTLDPGGVVRLTNPPASGKLVRAGFLFDVPVRFAEDKLEVSGAVFAAGEAPSVTVIEIREGEA